ncbi:hypothetical protein GIB67_000633 [Kingdonia uniflora]|uniref:Protein RIK n=1 Tax=Kingdonia uniflora TaxID=39325 RepID=A0A7J7NCS0_9MAGN|nr:hypothetical protein GIB67_000633 [Kingdonia uniflora]
MTEDNYQKLSEQSMATTTATARQRKRRKWDQPADSLISAGFALGNMVGIRLPSCAAQSSTALLISPIPAATCGSISSVPLINHNTAAVVQKLNQPKIQNELIAREIVINDAESSVRYKLTKRQTQEEIQRCTGAVVITRGRYHPPNALPDTEKPLYLHISAGAHLQETAERIKAVDRAAAMVENMLKPSLNSLPTSTPFYSVVDTVGQATQPLNTCAYLGFDTDPSLNIVARIRGPNDQYINHIMNETGATVLLRGRGSGVLESPHAQGLQEPLHLYLSCNNLKGLEHAKVLAENLLDTISIECGGSRVSSSKPYKAVPPPQQLSSGVQRSGNEQKVDFAGSATVAITSTAPVFSATPPVLFPPQQGGFLSYGQAQENVVCHLNPSSVSGGTSYSGGYGGIYPQVTPLQHVALALRQSPASLASCIVTSGTSNFLKNPESNTEVEKRLPQKRKFQEQPIASNGSAKSYQVEHTFFFW